MKEQQTVSADPEQGAVLIITLMIVTLITALVVEFSYGVYTATTALHNWTVSQRLSLAARSGIALSVKTVADLPRGEWYRFPPLLELPAENILDGFSGRVMLRAEDESARFNVNSLRDGEDLRAFKRLLRRLELDEAIADRVADWIDADSAPRQGDSEDGAKNAYMEGINELLLIKGIDQQAFDRLAPYITVYGMYNPFDNYININTAPIPVIMSLDERITEGLAEAVLQYRAVLALREPSDMVKVPGFGRELGLSLANRIVTRPLHFRIRATAEENRIRRIIEAVVRIDGTTATIHYWLEV